MKVIGYIRKSPDHRNGNGSGYGLEAQAETIRRESAGRGWELVSIEQDVLSGKNANRPGLKRALEACRSGAVDGVVVAKLDRLSRSVIDFAGLLEDARKRSYNIVALDFGLDLSAPQGELVANVLASVAQWERRIIAERTREGLAAAKARGVKIGPPVMLNPKTRARIRQARSRGLSYQRIADTLNREGVPTAKSGKRWYASTVRSAALGPS